MISLVEYYQKNQFIPTTFDIMSEDKLEQHRRKRENLYVNKLSIPNMTWRNACVLEAGCASGENSLIYAQMGARLTLIEPMESSINKLGNLFRHYNMEESVEKIYIDTIENVTLDKQYDIIVAEGFIHALDRKRDVIRRLYRNLCDGGLLIVSANNSVGCFCECVKSAIAQLYCLRNNISELNDKVAAVRSFFSDDFERIPHSRPFELWAKDTLFNPLITSGSFYDFDRMIDDLSDMQPAYYSSWPSYKHANDLKWHKYIPDNSQETDKAIQGYKLRLPSFLLGAAQLESEALKYLLEHRDSNFQLHIESVLAAVNRELHEGQAGSIISACRELKEVFHGKIQRLFLEIIDNLTDLNPDTYRKSTALRRHWGVPYHYIVFYK